MSTYSRSPEVSCVVPRKRCVSETTSVLMRIFQHASEGGNLTADEQQQCVGQRAQMAKLKPQIEVLALVLQYGFAIFGTGPEEEEDPEYRRCQEAPAGAGPGRAGPASQWERVQHRRPARRSVRRRRLPPYSPPFPPNPTMSLATLRGSGEFLGYGRISGVLMLPSSLQSPAQVVVLRTDQQSGYMVRFDCSLMLSGVLKEHCVLQPLHLAMYTRQHHRQKSLPIQQTLRSPSPTLPCEVPTN